VQQLDGAVEVPNQLQIPTCMSAAPRSIGLPGGRRELQTGLEAVRLVELTVSPAGEPQQGGGTASGEVVVVTGQYECPPGVRRRAGRVAVQQARSRAPHLDSAWKLTESVFFNHDPVGYVGVWVQPPLSGTQPYLDVGLHPTGQQHPGITCAAFLTRSATHPKS